MKNNILKKYLVSIQSEEFDFIEDVKMSRYDDETATYTIKYYDSEKSKFRQKQIKIKLSDYYKFVTKNDRKDKLSKLCSKSEIK